jgi:UDP-glucose 6-dehydrogenase
MLLTWEHFYLAKFALRSNKSETYLRIWADFFWNFGLISPVSTDLWILRGRKVCVWGLAFKPNTDDVRFAPSLSIIKRLLAEGAEIRAYDPQGYRKRTHTAGKHSMLRRYV